MDGQNVNGASAQNIQGSPGSGGIFGGIISALHNGIFDWVNLGENRRIQDENLEIARKNLENNQRQVQYQFDFAQKGIGWRVSDAKKSGIHPLYALGANIPTYTPVDMSMPQQQPVDYKIRNPYESYLQGQSSVLTLENQKLQNDLLRSQIASNDLANSQSAKHLKDSLDSDSLVTQSLGSEFKGDKQYYGLGLTAKDWSQFMQEYGSENPFKFGLASYLDRRSNHPKTLEGKEFDLLSHVLGIPRFVDKSKGEKTYFETLYPLGDAWETAKDWYRAGRSWLRNKFR